LWNSTYGLGNVTFYGYDAAGRLASISDRQSPPHVNGFTYNAAGQLATLADGNGNVTAWAYDMYGNNIAKTNGNNVVVSTNSYYAGGRLQGHWTPAKGLTQYTYDANGNPQTVSFSSGPGITAGYDALNRIIAMTDAVGNSTFTYQNFGPFQGALASAGGLWPGDGVTSGFVNRLRQSLLVGAPTAGNPVGNWSEAFRYDALERMALMSSPAGNFRYTYNGVGRQIQNVTLGAANEANSYGGGGQLLSTALKTPGGAVLDSYAYGYDADARRTSVQRTDNSHVNYNYDDLSELTSATGYEPSGTPRANENFGYGYDLAGNLLQRTNNTLIQELTSDNANEVVNIQRNNNLLPVAGSLNGTVASLAINGQAAAVYGDTTYAVVSGVVVTNGLNTLTAVVNGTQTNQVGEFLPVGVSLQYDLNGNLISDGQRTYAYDCANELVQVITTNAFIASLPTTNSCMTKYAYDGFGRRRVRQEYVWGPVEARSEMTYGWVKANEVRYLYDGMTVLQERDGNNYLLADYTRGVDLSGTLQGAGGVGGLLARTDNTGNSAYYHADGNGNVTMLVDGSGNLLAKYLYDSFGNTLGMWGPLAATNIYRFSSKEMDLTSGTYYFGHRYYQPNLQRWLNQDPIGERGGLNLYAYVGNNPVNWVDPLGLAIMPPGFQGPLQPGILRGS